MAINFFSLGRTMIFVAYKRLMGLGPAFLMGKASTYKSSNLGLIQRAAKVRRDFFVLLAK